MLGSQNILINLWRCYLIDKHAHTIDNVCNVCAHYQLLTFSSTIKIYYFTR